MRYFFQGSDGGAKTEAMICATLLQPQMDPPLLDGLIFLYNGAVLPSLDHVNLSGILILLWRMDAVCIGTQLHPPHAQSFGIRSPGKLDCIPHGDGQLQTLQETRRPMDWSVSTLSEVTGQDSKGNCLQRLGSVGDQARCSCVGPWFLRAYDLQRLKIHTPEFLGFHDGQLVDDALPHLDGEFH